MPRPIAFERGGDGIDRAGVTEHADFHRAHFEVGKDRVDLRGDEICRHVVNAEHALGVLCGERGDDRRAIDAQRGKRFQIGFDAGAAARIRSGNGDGDGGTHLRLPSFL